MLKNFVTKTFLFLIPLFLFWTYIELGLHYVPTSYSKTKTMFDQKKDDVEVLVIGNSETQLGIAPKYFKNRKSYNLSNVGQTLYTSIQLIRSNLNELKDLKLVFLGISPWEFMSANGPSIDEWREKFYYHFWNILPEEKNPEFIWHLRSGIYDSETMLNYAVKGFHNIPTPYIDAIDSTGWERGYMKNSAILLNDEVGKKIALTHFENVVYSFNPVNINYIIYLNKILQERDIKLILVQVPKSKYYLKHLPKRLFDKNNAILDSLQKTYDISNDNFLYDTSFTDKDFRDVNHLNYIGAEKFSKILSQIIDKNLP